MLTKIDKKLFGSCYYVFFVNGILALMVGAMMPYLRQEYGISYQLAGMLVSAHSVGNLISSFAGGLLPLYIGRKKSIMLFTACGVAAFLLIIAVNVPAVLILAFLMTGIARGAASNFCNTMINEAAPGKAWALNILHAVFSVGAFLAPFLVLFWTRNNAGNWIYASLTAAALLATSMLLQMFMNIKNDKPRKADAGKSNWGFLKDRQYLTAAGILFSYLCAEQAVNGWLVTYLQESGIMSPNFSQIMASVLWMVMLGGRLLTAWISGRMEKSQLLLLSSFGYIVCFVLLITSRSFGPAALGVIGVGFFMAGLYPTTVSSIGHIAVKYPMALSTVLTFAGLGAILMPAAIGIVAEKVGIIGGMSIVTIAVIITCLLIIYNRCLYKKSQV